VAAATTTARAPSTFAARPASGQIFGSVLFFALSLVIYSPLVVQRLLPAGITLFALLLVTVLWSSVTDSRNVYSGYIAAVLGIVAWAIGSATFLDGLPALFRYTCLFPVAFLAGRAIFDRRFEFIRAFAMVSVAMALMAIVERFLGRSFLGFGELSEFVSRGRVYRSFVASDHPLVLAVLLTVAISFVLFSGYFGRPILLTIVLVSGVWCTDGRIPLLVAALIIALYVVSRFLLRRYTMSRATVYSLLTLAVAVWFALTFFKFDSEYSSATAESGSAEYRYAIYSLLPDMVQVNPFGSGLGDLVAGQWYIYRNQAAYDISATVDAEPVLLTLRFGFIGVLFFVLLLVVVAYRFGRSELHLVVACASVLLCSMSLALTAWNTLGVAFFMLLGLTLRTRGTGDGVLPSGPPSQQHVRQI
jgi:hypothetical protein